MWSKSPRGERAGEERANNGRRGARECCQSFHGVDPMDVGRGGSKTVGLELRIPRCDVKTRGEMPPAEFFAAEDWRSRIVNQNKPREKIGEWKR